jgi:hypothetical protein
MAESAIETVFSLFACAIFFLTCVSIIGSIIVALRAVRSCSTTSTSGQRALAIDVNTQREDSPEATREVLRAGRGLTPRPGDSPISMRRHQHASTAMDKRIA